MWHMAGAWLIPDTKQRMGAALVGTVSSRVRPTKRTSRLYQTLAATISTPLLEKPSAWELFHTSVTMGFQESERSENKSLRLLLNPTSAPYKGTVSEKQLLDVWYYLKYPNKVTEEMDWPFSSLDNLAPFLQPHFVPGASSIPPAIVAFLIADIRKYDEQRRVQHAAFCLRASVISLDSFWTTVLHGLLMHFTACKKVTTSGEHVHVLIMNNLLGLDTQTEQ